MPNAIDGLRQVAERLRERGERVTFVPGWETRGSGTLAPRGFVWHHTANPGSGNARSLRLVTFGRDGLRNALCTWFCAVDGELFLVAARTAWHAGSGGWRGLSGNSSVLGCEWESDGTSERATPAADRAMLALAQECGAVFGYPPGNNAEHKEWTPRKIDRYGYSGPAWRQAIAHGSPAPSIEEDDDMGTTAYHQEVPPDGKVHSIGIPPPDEEHTGEVYVSLSCDVPGAKVRAVLGGPGAWLGIGPNHAPDFKIGPGRIIGARAKRGAQMLAITNDGPMAVGVLVEVVRR